MPRKLRVEYPGAIYHVMSRANGRGNIFETDVDRQDFVEDPGGDVREDRFRGPRLLPDAQSFSPGGRDPNGNLVGGMRWFLSAYTLRFNPRHKRFGHVFSGRYKALMVDGSGNGYLRTVCDYVHLNPVRAKLLRPEQRLLEYPWSSFGFYLAARATDRPGCGWIGCWGARHCSRTTRRAAAIRAADGNAAGRGERWGRVEGDSAGMVSGASGVQGEPAGAHGRKLGEHHSGELKRESAEAKAERIIREELKRLGWSTSELSRRPKSDPAKLAMASRLRRETTLPLKSIAVRLHMGTWKSLNAKLYRWRKTNETPGR